MTDSDINGLYLLLALFGAVNTIAAVACFAIAYTLRKRRS